MTAIIVTILRVVGVIWAIGAVFIMNNARASGWSDAARWVFVGGVLTFVAGIMLAAGSRWAAIPAVLVAIQQGVFHWRQTRDLPPGAPRPAPHQVRIAVLVATATLILVAKGALR
ncbi:MAG: hypothetical protein ACE5EU_09030 [Paracoccaceae bacterium]